jgi:hypothetical protein
LAFVLLIVPCTRAQSQSDANRLDKIKQDWTRYREFAKTWSGTCTSNLTKNDKLFIAHVSQIRQLDGMQVCVRQFSAFDQPKYDKYGYVWGYNAKYAFSLFRRAKGEPWIMTGISDSRKVGDSTTAEARGAVNSCLQGILNVREDLDQIVIHPMFKLKKLSGTDVVTLEFECPHPLESKPFFSVQSGTLKLDALNHHVLLEGNLSYRFSGNDVRCDYVTEYAESNSSFRLPKRTIERAKNLEPNTSKVVSQSFRENTFQLKADDRDVTDRDFTLTAYGLPEPYSTQSGSSVNWWYFLGAAGVGILVLSYFLKRRSAAGGS